MKVAIIGAGGWGTALANVAAINHNQVAIWVRRPELAEKMIKSRENTDYLPGIKISDSIDISSNLGNVIKDAGCVVMAVPSQAMDSVAKQVCRYIEKKDTIIVSASKGLEIGSFRRMSEILAQHMPAKIRKNIAVLSGPSHAEEVGKNLPAAVVAASERREIAEAIQDIFMNEFFRVYTNPDIKGVELGGALKNIIAIAVGISDGLGYGDNTRAALITRGIVEITRLGVQLGAHPATFAGLAGIGDLVVTCNSMHSRNRRAGIQIGQGIPPKQVIESTNMVIEGITTTKAVFPLAQRHGIEMPITEQLHAVLFQQKDPLTAVSDLMRRDGKHEIEEVVSYTKRKW